MFQRHITMTVTVMAATLVLLSGSVITSGAESPRPAPPAVATGDTGDREGGNPAVVELAAPGAALDNATLGQVAGGARLSAPIGTVPRQLATIKLWDEGRTRLMTGTDQGVGPAVVTVTSQQGR